MPTSTPVRRRLVLVVIAVVVITAGMAGWHHWGRPEARAKRLLRQAGALRAAGEIRRAEDSAVAALELDSNRGEAAVLAAECALARGNPPAAFAYLQRVTSADSATQVRGLLIEGRLQRHWRGHFADAERCYRAVLGIDPENREALEGLANLLGLCGRRQEAIVHVLKLVSQGHASDLLVLLARESGGVLDPDALQAARRAAPDDLNPLVGQAWQASSEGHPEKALELLCQALSLRHDHPAALVALGTQWLALRRFEDLERWARTLPMACDDYGDSWMVRAQLAEQAGNRAGAIRCYWEALRRAPESKTSNYRLSRLLEEDGRSREAGRFAEHLARIRDLEGVQDRVLFSQGFDSAEGLLGLARSYEAAGRLWEAWGWSQLSLQSDPTSAEARETEERLQKIVERSPFRLTMDEANPAMAVNLSEYPLPSFVMERSTEGLAGRSPCAAAATSADAAAAQQTPTFRNDSADVGLRFRYFNGVEGPPTRRMFELTGGGVGVLDFDLDGSPDVYFTQGVPWPPGAQQSSHHDALFRNLAGTRFEEVSSLAGIEEAGFGQGVAIGDVDADGFPDLYVANIGGNQLWRNNGDGTFSNVTAESGITGDAWTTSCLLADVNGDGFPDIYDVNYVMAADVFDRVCPDGEGKPRLCMPFHFDSQPDRFWLNDGQGRFTDATREMLSTIPEGKGLGVAAWDADGSGRLSIFVANDTTPSFFFVPEGDNGSRRLKEFGLGAGVALNGDGKATGCMGVAIGDANEDGQPDLYITNFLGESNSMFLSTGPGSFEDRTREVGLQAPSLEKLGFGTQFLDADLDGRLELFVANGHIDDLSDQGRPYRMRPQLFSWTGREYVEAPAAELGPYFQQDWLGRPAARVDWNRDGLEDLIVGHLQDESALLTNTTPAHGRFVALKLIGLTGGRDAIGATVTARAGERTLVRQLSAGDGYQASNERRVVFGIGDADRLEQITIRWPGGREQSIDALEAGTESVVVEGAAPLLIRSIKIVADEP